MHPAFVHILDHVASLQEEVPRSGEVAWFRGHSSATWQLKSSLHRFIEGVFATAGQTLTPAELRDVLRSEFKSLYHTFKHDAWRLLDPTDRGEWSIIFHMQHHGLPTPLLDWSESFACALFFAHETWRPPDDAAIFVLDPAALNSRVAGINAQITLDDNVAGEARVKTNLWHPQFEPPDQDRPCLAVTPIRSNYRMLAQRATFTLSGDSFESLDAQYEGIIRKIILPAAIYSDVERFLNLVNVGVQGYFPDLQGLQRKYRSRLEWHLREAERARRSGAAG